MFIVRDIPQTEKVVYYSIPKSGVMILIPFLIECGMISYRFYYDARLGYYTFEFEP